MSVWMSLVRMLLGMVMVMFYVFWNIVITFFVLEEDAAMQTEGKFILTKAERQIIELIRALDYGEVRIMIKDRKPLRVEEIRRSIQLPSEK